jgi:hypothetical protein
LAEFPCDVSLAVNQDCVIKWLNCKTLYRDIPQGQAKSTFSSISPPPLTIRSRGQSIILQQYRPLLQILVSRHRPLWITKLSSPDPCPWWTLLAVTFHLVSNPSLTILRGCGSTLMRHQPLGLTTLESFLHDPERPHSWDSPSSHFHCHCLSQKPRC